MNARARQQISVAVVPERVYSAQKRIRVQIIGPRGGVESTVYLTVQDSALIRSLLHRCETTSEPNYTATFGLD